MMLKRDVTHPAFVAVLTFAQDQHQIAGLTVGAAYVRQQACHDTASTVRTKLGTQALLQKIDRLLYQGVLLFCEVVRVQVHPRKLLSHSRAVRLGDLVIERECWWFRFL